ncbi:MAG TPA: hypothetical protein VI197_13770, partial [Polyangiaceae bacterium]
QQPWAKGGADTADNLGLRCPAHNALEADRDYGTGFMAHKRARKPLKVREPLARYVLRDAVPVASTSVATSGAGGPASGGTTGLRESVAAAGR